jgi:hypothetical protein
MQKEPLTLFVRGDYTVTLLGKAHKSWKMMQDVIYFNILMEQCMDTKRLGIIIFQDHKD